MIKTSGVLLACFGLILLAGCASTTILPRENNTYSLVTTSDSLGTAEKAAGEKAEEHCAKQGKRLIVLQHSNAYHGVDKTNAALIGLASALVANQPNPATSSDDYEVTMQFRCQ